MVEKARLPRYVSIGPLPFLTSLAPSVVSAPLSDLSHTPSLNFTYAQLPAPMAGTNPRDNPYLAHHYNRRKGAAPEPPVPAPSPSMNEPLYGFLPRKVTGEQVRKALVRN